MICHRKRLYRTDPPVSLGGEHKGGLSRKDSRIGFDTRFQSKRIFFAFMFTILERHSKISYKKLTMKIRIEKAYLLQAYIRHYDNIHGKLW
jgi:hypothetical protein